MAKGSQKKTGKNAKTGAKTGGKDAITTIARNRKARHDYHIEDTYEAGLVLTGTEVKSLREGRASLTDGFGLIFQGEAWLEGVYIPEYVQGTWTNHAARRRRKMLLHKDEILKISHKLKESGRTLVPLELYFVGSRVKVEIAVALGKKDWDKRQALREKQDAREAQRAMSLRRHM
ncbi:SsrA-binding protein SmpB [Nocardia zapadnayensis]|nr:SsrA-binding protein SmpB [Nocardia zapadnayensis]MCX0277682.1 SsrA-binding protein SmpB [Nocardia zapadnayensis]